jgi:hypothetical protein
MTHNFFLPLLLGQRKGNGLQWLQQLFPSFSLSDIDGAFFSLFYSPGSFLEKSFSFSFFCLFLSKQGGGGGP